MAKKLKSKEGIIPLEVVAQKIFVLRGRRVVLDRDLADLFGVETRVLNQAVKRNSDRFPEDFMFQLSMEEARTVYLSRSQTVTLKRGGNIKYRPHVFTEHGVDARQRAPKPSGGSCQHSGRPRVRAFAPDTRDPRRPGAED
jgi:hypothetical protein